MIDSFSLLVCSDTADDKRQQSLAFAQANRLAVRENLSALSDNEAVFEWQADKLFLNIMLENKLTQLAFDLVEGEVGFRAARVNKSNEVIAKAIGCKSHYRPKVLDATAGMGRDAFIMALLGCNVIMQERNFAIHLLLQNALARLKAMSQFSEVAAKLNLVQANSIQLAQGDSLHAENGDKQLFDVIYLDPMFPERKKSALVKKEMRLFKRLAGEDPDADQLLEIALSQPVKRVVVKRPKGAPILANRKPSHEITAKKFRYDVYLVG